MAISKTRKKAATKKVESADMVANTLAERGNTHGAFEHTSFTERRLKEAMTQSVNWHMLDDSKKAALDMIAHKMARILNGDPDFIDHWHDIEGYSRLAKNRCGLPSVSPMESYL